MDRLSQILDKPMDRKDFLRQIGVGGMLLLGGNLIIKTLLGLGKDSRASSSSQGYGSSPYGGTKH